MTAPLATLALVLTAASSPVAYAYGSSRPHAPTHVGTRSFTFDANGNQLGWDEDRSGLRRTILWDEENRPRAISDNGRTTRFVYDEGGDRVFKTGAQGETAYVNAFWTVRNGAVGTKHVFVGSTRIASKISPGEAAVTGDPDPWMVMLARRPCRRSRHAADAMFSRTIRGCRAAIRNSAMAGPSGYLRPCSQLRSVCTLIPRA